MRGQETVNVCLVMLSLSCLLCYMDRICGRLIATETMQLHPNIRFQRIALTKFLLKLCNYYRIENEQRQNHSGE